MQAPSFLMIINGTIRLCSTIVVNSGYSALCSLATKCRYMVLATNSEVNDS
ncbi:hypothetical protein HanPSC8_Chr07g0280061 [Helianthus annuus]|nr:hypothetical protein HanPSC8_Chr07g0280061 [Helianthus annuus]